MVPSLTLSSPRLTVETGIDKAQTETLSPTDDRSGDRIVDERQTNRRTREMSQLIIGDNSLSHRKTSFTSSCVFFLRLTPGMYVYNDTEKMQTDQ